MSKSASSKKENRERVNEILTNELINQLTNNTHSGISSSESYTKKLGMVLDVVKPKGMRF